MSIKATGALAQLVEQRTENPCVPGSIPGGTTLKTPRQMSWGFFNLDPMHYLYVIYSEHLKRYYIGESQDPENRLEQHNTHYFKNNFTKAANDWVIKLKYPTNSKEDAIFLEKFIKRMKSKKFIEKVISKQSILTEILEKSK